jgi:hypothetical protein
MARLALSASLLIALAACGGPQFRHDHVGTGYAGRGGVKLDTTGTHQVTWAIATPRAMRLAWSIDCGGVVQAGTAGETFEEYRTRRVAEIRAEREKQKQAISSIGGAVLGTVGAGAVAETPNGEARADVAVDGEAVGAVVAEGVISDDIQLPAGDVGAGKYGGTVTLGVDQPGVCTMAVGPEVAGEDAAGVTGEFRVVHVVDVYAERAAAAARYRAAAIDVRGSLQADLVARGADPELQARLEAQRLAEATARAEAEARVRAEREAAQAVIDAERARERAARDAERAARDAERRARADAEAAERARIRAERDAKARLEIEARLRVEAELRARVVIAVTATRQAQLSYLVGVCGASAEAYHAKLEAEERARVQAELELRLRLEAQAEARARAEAEARARDEAEMRAHAERLAERERRRSAALAVRGDVLLYLTMLGAVEKPPMPEPMYEDPGEPPMAGATWAAGEWSWQGGAWVWLSGGWTIPDDGFSVSVSVDNEPRDTGTTIVVEQPDRDPEPSRPVVRDHRDDRKPEPKPEPARPRVRDHRDDKKDEKQEDKKDDDDRPRVRDHRR